MRLSQRVSKAVAGSSHYQLNQGKLKWACQEAASYLDRVAGLFVVIKLFGRTVAVKLIDHDVDNPLCNGLRDVNGLPMSKACV